MYHLIHSNNQKDLLSHFTDHQMENEIKSFSKDNKLRGFESPSDVIVAYCFAFEAEY